MPQSLNAEAVDRFAELAEEYCAFFESWPSSERDAFLREAHRRLPTLYAAALQLPDVYSDPPEGTSESEEAAHDDEDDATMDTMHPDPDRMDSERWMATWRALGKHLGDRKLYQEMFAPYKLEETEPVIGDLADDLTDIYADLARGLAKWRRQERDSAAWEWQFHFACHWGEHLTSALRALHALAFDEGLEPPPLRRDA